MLMELIPGLPDDLGRECLTHVSYKEFSKFFYICKSWKAEIGSRHFHQLRKANGFNRNIIVLTQVDQDSSLVSGNKHSSTPAYQLSLYEPETGLWSRLPAIPGFSNGIPLFCRCVGVGHYLVLIGGWNPTSWKASNTVFVYDFVTATWKRGVDMPGPSISFFGCASDYDQTIVLVAGGHDEEKNALRSALLYDVIKDEWISLPDMAKERDECKAIFHAGKFHVISGYSTEMQGKFQNDAEVFDTATSSWCHVDNNFHQTDEICPPMVVNRKGEMFRCCAGSVEIWEASMWKSVTQLPPDVCVGSVMLTWQEKMLVIGSDKFGGTQNMYVLELKGINKCYCWKKVELPLEFSGRVQAGCSLEI
ncbi:F-box/kelch-repeat protein [Thalictrum thalictroides]|uniref:F-box/kelch-repeat protein n=1 Tax=Thalictrum thalictroides TaxID=46969 RepID=A0A7J6WT78_THATH|nr:F-box/kelch-repeat protein [Thalictrum thalictroides]